MANSIIQLRVDKKLKDDAISIYEKLGMDLSTAIRIFLTRSVEEQGIPFEMKLKSERKQAWKALAAVEKIQNESEVKGINRLSFDEIEAEINASRKGM